MLPPLLLSRILRSLMAKRVPVTRIAATAPLIAVFVVSWGIGEVFGYWFGAGDSLARVR
jgi:hypothetical protein